MKHKDNKKELFSLTSLSYVKKKIDEFVNQNTLQPRINFLKEAIEWIIFSDKYLWVKSK